MNQEENGFKVCDIQKYNELKEVDKEYVKRVASIGISIIGIVVWLKFAYQTNLPVLTFPAILNSSCAGLLTYDLVKIVAKKIGLEKDINDAIIELKEKGKNK